MSTEPISQTGVAPNVQFMVNIRAVPLTGPSGPIETLANSIHRRFDLRVPLTGPSGPILSGDSILEPPTRNESAEDVAGCLGE